MTQNETKFMDSALALAETLNFTKAAKRLRISQPMVTKNIQELENILGFRLFDRDRKTVVLNDAGRAYLEKAKLSIMYAGRAFQAARDVMRDADTVLHVGRSPYTDPFLVTTLHSIHLPLYARLRVELSSHFSCQLIDEVLEGALDFAIATEPPESPLLTTTKVSESPFYIAMSKKDKLADCPSVTFRNFPIIAGFCLSGVCTRRSMTMCCALQSVRAPFQGISGISQHPKRHSLW